MEKYEPEYNRITDAYIERMIYSGRQDRIVNILQERYRKRECVSISCSKIDSRESLIREIQKGLRYPSTCGKNWHAIEDLIHDVILPYRHVLTGWHELETTLPEDARILKSLLRKIVTGDCQVSYD